MTRRRRLLVASLGALLALSLVMSPVFAVVTHSYTSTWSQWSANYQGPARVYSGNQIHIQLNAAASSNGTYHISVEQVDCLGPICWDTEVGSAGNCPYNGFCGLVWNINLNSSEHYAFYFQKPNDLVTVHSDNVQMWSTAP